MDVGDVALAAIIGATIVIAVVAQAIVRIRTKTGTQPRQLDSIEARLANIERGLDGMAVEVERLTEAHRYTAKLPTERVREPQPAEKTAPHTL